MHKCPKCGGNMRWQKTFLNITLYLICDLCGYKYPRYDENDNYRRFGKA